MEGFSDKYPQFTPTAGTSGTTQNDAINKNSSPYIFGTGPSHPTIQSQPPPSKAINETEYKYQGLRTAAQQVVEAFDDLDETMDIEALWKSIDAMRETLEKSK